MISFSLIKNSRAFAVFACVFTILAIAYYILEYINGRNQMADFRVYYDACNQFIHGEEVYGQSYGVSSGFYKYSPIALFVFIPFALLPYFWASILFYVLIILLFIELCARLFRVLNVPEAGKKTIWFLVIISLFAADHIERELHLGNVNLFLLLLCFWLFRNLEQKRILNSSIILAVLLLFKPHFVILIPLLIWRIRWKELLYSFLLICTGLLIPALYAGWQGNLDLLESWMSAIRDHNLSLENSPNTIYGLIHMGLSSIGLELSSRILVLGSLAIAAGLCLLYLLHTRGIKNESHRWFLELFFLVGMIPNLTHTDTEHFIWSWPLIGFIVWNLLLGSFRWKPLYAILMLLAFVPYVLNSPDIVGQKTMLLFDQGGGLGLANLTFVILTFMFVFFHMDILNGKGKSS